MLVASLRLTSICSQYSPCVLPLADRKYVQVVVFNFDIWLIAFKTAEDINTLFLDFLSDVVPLNIRQIIHSEHFSFLIRHKTHGSGIDRAWSFFRISDLDLLPLLAFQVDA